jgi:transcriptional regulator with XRE-family HTH domain
MTKRTSAPAKAPAKKPTERTSPNAKRESVPRTTAGTFERLSPEAFKLADLQLRKLFGRNVRQARRRAGLTQVQVADIIGSTQPFIGAVERGEQNVKLATIVRLAYAVRTDPGTLLLGDAPANYSLETLVRLVAALNAYLQTTISEKGADMSPAAMFSLIPQPLEVVTAKRSGLPGRKA